MAPLRLRFDRAGVTLLVGTDGLNWNWPTRDRSLQPNPSPCLSGLPGWRETYDIEAKAPANALPESESGAEHRRPGQRCGSSLMRKGVWETGPVAA